ncbi:MAG: hypothetical protein WDN28_27070 [Chthoniobacter sp.]
MPWPSGFRNDSRQFRTVEGGRRAIGFVINGSIDKPKTNLLDKLIGQKINNQFGDVLGTIFGGDKKPEDDKPKKEDKKKKKDKDKAAQNAATPAAPTPPAATPEPATPAPATPQTQPVAPNP